MNKELSKAWDFIHKKDPAFDTSEEDLIKLFALLPTNQHGRILDMGCGKALTASLAIRNGLDYYGCDISSFAINNFNDNNGSFADKVVAIDCSSTPWQENFFDSIISIRSLDCMSFEKAQAAVSEAFRLLKPEGTFLALVQAEEDLNFTGFREDKIIRISKSKEVILNSFTKLKLSRLFEPLFEIRKCSQYKLNSASDSQFWLVELKKR